MLFGQIKGKVLAGDARVTYGGKSYSVVKDRDARGDFYVLTLEG